MANDEEIAAAILSILESQKRALSALEIQNIITGDLPLAKIETCLGMLCTICIVTQREDKYVVTPNEPSTPDLPAQQDWTAIPASRGLSPTTMLSNVHISSARPKQATSPVVAKMPSDRCYGSVQPKEAMPPPMMASNTLSAGPQSAEAVFPPVMDRMLPNMSITSPQHTEATPPSVIDRAANQLLPYGADRAVTRAQAGAAVNYQTENLPLVSYNQQDLQLTFQREFQGLMTALKNSTGPLKAHQLKKNAKLKDKSRCNKLLYFLERKKVVQKEGALWKICDESEPLSDNPYWHQSTVGDMRFRAENRNRNRTICMTMYECTKADICSFSAELSGLPQGKRESFGDSVECDCPNRGPGCNHVHVNNTYLQVGDNNNITINTLHR